MAFARVALLLLCSLVALAEPNPAVEGGSAVNQLEANTAGSLSKASLEDSFIRRLGGKCTQKDNSSCVMLKLVTYMNRMLKKSSINLGESLELLKTRSDEQLTSDPDADELAVLARATSSDDHKLSVLVADKIWRFIHSRSIRWRAARAADVVVASGEHGKLNFGVSLDTRRLFEEGRGRLKRYAPILTAVVMKAVLVGALVLKGIALLVGKALLVSKLALVLASVLGIKKLLHKKHVTYEVVAHAPEPHHHVDSYSSGWARALDGFVESFSNELSRRLRAADPHDLAYHQQQPQAS